MTLGVLPCLLVKYRIKNWYLNYLGTRKIKKTINTEKYFVCECFLRNATLLCRINLEHSVQYFECQQLRKLPDIQSWFHKPLSTGTAHWGWVTIKPTVFFPETCSRQHIATSPKTRCKVLNTNQVHYKKLCQNQIHKYEVKMFNYCWQS